MRDVFIPTQNFQKLEELCNELLESSVNLEMAAVQGPAGRGKTTAAERIVTMNPGTVYVYFEPRFSPVGLIREIAFAITGVRPSYTQTCIDMIQDELSRMRRIIIIDEADQMGLNHFHTLRAFHDLRKAPILMIGTDLLRRKLERDQRFISRVRQALKFEPVGQPDVVVFYRQALSKNLEKDHSIKLLRHAKGDFRNILKDAVKVERYMKTSGITKIDDRIVNKVCGDE